jgi:catechol 2,3-dioxygenase
MAQAKGRVKALGEIALRVEDLDAMQQFYQEVIGLQLLKRFDHAAFFRVADGFEGHTQILALFDRREQPDYQSLDVRKSTIDHIAFAISLEDFETEKRRLEARGLQVDLAEHGWVRWRSLYVTDPEGNRVEFVCYDERVV